MGRIVVYSTPGCPHCVRAKNLLKKKKVDFYEIDLEKYPDRREEMMGYSLRKTVPQIFFNENHIGGADDLYKLEEEKKLDDLIKECLASDVGVFPIPPKEVQITKPNQRKGPKKKKKRDAVDEMYEQIISKGFVIRTIRKKFRRYRHSFRGTDLVAFMLAKAIPSGEKTEIIKACGVLVDRGYIIRLVKIDDPKLDFVSPHVIYRWAKDANPYTLNQKRIWKDNARDAVKLAAHLQKQLLKLEERFITDDGIDYKSMGKSDQFKQYCNTCLEMQATNLRKLSENDRKVFFINIYNALVIHATIVLGPPSTALQRGRFFNRVSYEIGGYMYSLNDIEHGILRCNRKAPGKLKKQFSANDPRMGFVLPTFDQRIHFALVCGAKSCPPVKVYTSDNLDKALQWAAEAFCADEVVVDMNARVVTISKLFSWYKKDFGKNKEELLQSIAKYKKDDKKFRKLIAMDGVNVAYFKYDWDSNGRGTAKAEEEEEIEEDSLSDASVASTDSDMSFHTKT